MNQRKIGALLAYLSMALGFIIQIGYTPIMLRALGKSEFGLYSLVISIVSYLGLLSFGFSGAYMRFYYRFRVEDDKLNISRLNGLFLSVFALFALLALISGGGLVAWAREILGDKFSLEELQTAKVLMAVLVVNIALTFLTTVFDCFVSAHEKFLFQKSLQIARLVCSPLLSLPVLLLGYGSIGMVAITTTVNISIILVNIYYCFKKLDMEVTFRNIDLSLLREVFFFSFFMFLNMIIDQVNWNVGKFLIGRFHGAPAVSNFGLAVQVNTYFISLSTALSMVFIPMVNNLIARKSFSEVNSLFHRIGRLQFILLSMICTGIVFLGKPFLTMWAGQEYSDSYYILLLLVIPVMIPLIQNLGIEIQKAMNKHHFRSIIYFIMAVMNICMSIPLVKSLGGLGAGIATAVSLLVANGIIINLYYHFAMKLNMIAFWGSIMRFIPALILPTVFGCLAMEYVDLYNLINFMIVGFLYAIIFTASFWTFGFNEYEKELVYQAVSRVSGVVKKRT